MLAYHDLKHFYIVFKGLKKLLKKKRKNRPNPLVKVRTGKRYDTRF